MTTQNLKVWLFLYLKENKIIFLFFFLFCIHFLEGNAVEFYKLLSKTNQPMLKSTVSR